MESRELTAAHLLTNHDNTRSLSRTTKTGNGEDFNKTCEHVAGLGQSLLFQKSILIDQLCMDEIEITCGLKRAVSKSQERLVGLAVSTFLHKPTR